MLVDFKNELIESSDDLELMIKEDSPLLKKLIKNINIYKRNFQKI